MSYMNAKKKYQKEPQQDDGYAQLLCCVPGCGKRWSVNMDSPKCSNHQWQNEIVDFPALPFSKEYRSDGLGWAKKIVDLHKQGFQIRSYSVKMAYNALKIKMENSCEL